MDKRKVIYYRDELNDEFSTAQITPRVIDGEYIYCRDSLGGRIAHFFCYRTIAAPLAFLYTKCAFHHKIIGKEKLRAVKKDGYFLFGNHTQDIADALIPSMLSLPKASSVIVHPNNVSMPILGRITPYLGALPLPDDMTAYKNFLKAIYRRYEQGHAVVIYPEAHIWPYYTDIRPFPDTSFQYPVKQNAPVFCFTNTYQKRRFGSKPKIVTYIDGPFYHDPSLSPRMQKKELRDRVYACMKKRAKSSTVVQIQYVKKEEDHNG